MLRTFALTSVVLMTFTSVQVLARDTWQTVRSPLGQFSVEMPSKPTLNKSRVRKEADGNVKTILIGCKGSGGVYMVYKIMLPTAIVKGTENDELDAERDGLAKEWKGKVTSERRIRAGDKIGRDFTVRGRPEKGEGVLTIRVREYLSGKSVYLVAVVSRPNRELPDDTGRFLGSLMIGKMRAAGSPAPEPKGTALSSWGEAFDPQKDAEIVGDKDRLHIKVTGSRHQKPAPQAILNAPRVMREVEGDFVMSVKVVGTFRPGGRSTNPKSVPFFGAGILVWSDPDNLIRLERAAVNRRGRIFPYVNFEEFEGGSRGASHNEVMRGGNCWVRMERKGSRIHGSISYDGKTWKDLKPIQTVWPAKLKVGLIATSSSSLPFSVTFEEFKFTGKSK